MRLAVHRWGEAGSPLMPETLRRALADEALPAWLRRDLGLPDDATPLSLDATVWRRVDTLPPRVESFIIGLVTYRSPAIRNVRLIDGAWPTEIPPSDISWPTRVYSRLLRAHLLDPARLESLTYGELLEIPGMGVKSVIELATIVENVAAMNSTAVNEDAILNEMLTISGEDWPERVRTDDPRFRDVVPAFPGSISELIESALGSPEDRRARTIADSLSTIRDRAHKIASEPIDHAFVGLLRSYEVSERNIAILLTRLGWGADGPHTLQEVGDAFGMTRERVRQIESRITKRLRGAYLPQVERAMELVASRAPLHPNEAAQVLVDEQISTVPVHPAGLRSVAELLGYEATFRIEQSNGLSYVLTRSLSGVRPVFVVARREAGRAGVSNTDEVQAELYGNGDTLSRDAVSRILRSSDKVEFLHEDWFWMPDIPENRNRLRNVSRRMLSVFPQLDLVTMRQGVRRRFRFMQIDLVPPINVLSAFYAAHPEFVLRDDGRVESAENLNYREVLGETEQVIVDILRASPTGLMDRAELEDAVTARGINANTFSVFTTYSPIIDHPAKNIWSLRGHVPDPAQLEALRAVLASRTTSRRALTYGWNADGSLRLIVELSNVASPVIGVPSAIGRYVADRRFKAKTKEGMPAGTIAVDERGVSWGYGPFLRRRGAERGDALTIQFDLMAETATLSLDDETVLFEEER